MPNVFLTPEKFEALKKELVEREKVTRREIADRLQAAIALGDLSENFEYHDAKDAQGYNEGRIRQIMAMIDQAVIVETQEGVDNISMGTRFRAKVGTMEKEFTVVGAAEASPMEGKISNESPIGQAFLGHKTGDVVEIEIPSGSVSYTIVEIF